MVLDGLELWSYMFWVPFQIHCFLIFSFISLASIFFQFLRIICLFCTFITFWPLIFNFIWFTTIACHFLLCVPRFLRFISILYTSIIFWFLIFNLIWFTAIACHFLLCVPRILRFISILYTSIIFLVPYFQSYLVYCHGLSLPPVRTPVPQVHKYFVHFHNFFGSLFSILFGLLP